MKTNGKIKLLLHKIYIVVLMMNPIAGKDRLFAQENQIKMKMK